MPTDVTVAVLRTPGAPLVVERFALADPKGDDVLVRITGVGLCATDLKARAGDIPLPLPLVLGHEGAGIVERVGPHARGLVPGDHVVLTSGFCGSCPNCRRGRVVYCEQQRERNFLVGDTANETPFARGDERVHGRFFGQSSFGSYALARDNGVVKVRDDAPIELLGPLGCGVQTGAGAILNVLRPPAGSSVAILGAGSVGLSALLAAKIACATTIAIVDVLPARLRLAEDLGASSAIDGGRVDVADALLALRPKGFDVVFDTTAHAPTIEHALRALRTGGVLGFTAGTFGARIAVDLQSLVHRGLTLRGMTQGESIPGVTIPQLIELYLAGRFPFDRLLRRYPLADVERAIDDMQRGETIKPVLIP